MAFEPDIPGVGTGFQEPNENFEASKGSRVITGGISFPLFNIILLYMPDSF